jgi:hypothetical protein
MGRRENVVNQKCEYFVIVELHAFVAAHVSADNLANPQRLNKVLDDRVSPQNELSVGGVLS